MSWADQGHYDLCINGGSAVSSSVSVENIVDLKVLCLKTMKEYMQSGDWGSDYASFMKEQTRSRIHASLCEANGSCEELCESVVKITYADFWELLARVQREIVEEANQKAEADLEDNQSQEETGTKCDNQETVSQQSGESSTNINNHTITTLHGMDEANKSRTNQVALFQLSVLNIVPGPSTSSLSTTVTPVIVAPILGIKDAKVPSALTQFSTWSTAQNSLLSMRQNNKDDQSCATELAKLFYSATFTEEEQLNCSQRKQKIAGGTKETRAFDPVKKEFVFSATAFCMNEQAADPFGFISALNSSSPSLRLSPETRIYLHTRIFSKHAGDVRTLLKQRLKSSTGN